MWTCSYISGMTAGTPLTEPCVSTVWHRLKPVGYMLTTKRYGKSVVQHSGSLCSCFT